MLNNCWESSISLATKYRDESIVDTLKYPFTYIDEPVNPRKYCYCNFAKTFSEQLVGTQRGRKGRTIGCRSQSQQSHSWHNFLRVGDGSQKTFILSPACAMSLRHIAERNLPRSIDTSVHDAGKLSRPQSFALWKVLLSAERSMGPFCETPSSPRSMRERGVILLSRLLLPPGCPDKYTSVHYWGWRSVSERLKVRIYILRYLRWHDAL